LEYRHAAHAANRSDLVKHLTLSALRHWPGLATIWDAFAAAPATPLAALASPRRKLLATLLRSTGPCPVAEFQASVRACRTPSGEACYPGSSQLLAQFDKVRSLVLSDNNGACIDQQREHFSAAAGLRVEALQMDSVRQAGMALQHRPDLIFIDPPFLQPKEWDGVLTLLQEIRHGCPASRIVLWYPLRDDLTVPQAFRTLPRVQLTVHFTNCRPLKGCAMVMLNFETGLVDLLRPVAEWFRGPALPGIGRVQLTE
jgi:23S rRNA (adenine2030-N6)-methyltransferase